MIPEVKDNITKTWSVNRKTAMLIESHIPPALKQNFLAEIGPEKIRNAPNPAAYFAALMRSAYPLSLVPGDSRHSIENAISRTERAGEDSRNFVIITTAGKRVHVDLGPDNAYGVVPTKNQRKLFNTNITSANGLLHDVKSIVNSLQRETGKAPR